MGFSAKNKNKIKTIFGYLYSEHVDNKMSSQFLINEPFSINLNTTAKTNKLGLPSYSLK